MESTAVSHSPFIIGLSALAFTLVGSIFAGGVAWGRFNHRTSTIERWIEQHEQWAHQRSDVVDELKTITVRLDAILESNVTRIDRLEKHEDEG